MFTIFIFERMVQMNDYDFKTHWFFYLELLFSKRKQKNTAIFRSYALACFILLLFVLFTRNDSVLNVNEEMSVQLTVKNWNSKVDSWEFTYEYVWVCKFRIHMRTRMNTCMCTNYRNLNGCTLKTAFRKRKEQRGITIKFRMYHVHKVSRRAREGLARITRCHV